jgi:hypothetical protein
VIVTFRREITDLFFTGLQLDGTPLFHEQAVRDVGDGVVVPSADTERVLRDLNALIGVFRDLRTRAKRGDEADRGRLTSARSRIPAGPRRGVRPQLRVRGVLLLEISLPMHQRVLVL